MTYLYLGKRRRRQAEPSPWCKGHSASTDSPCMRGTLHPSGYCHDHRNQERVTAHIETENAA